MAQVRTPAKVSNNQHKGMSDLQRRRQDALELAEIVYDIFREEKENDKLISGQNSAKQSNK